MTNAEKVSESMVIIFQMTMTVRQAIVEPQHMTQALFIYRTVINTNKVVQSR